MFKKNIKKRITKLTLATIFIFSLFFIISAQSINAQTGCSGQITGIDRYSICRVNAGESLFIPTQGCSVPSIQVNNNSSKDIFIPANACSELNSVIVHLPTNTSATISSGLISGETFTDSRDGQVYPIVEIGSQVWMAKNLAYLPSVVGPATGSGTIPYYYVYGYDDGTDVSAAKATIDYHVFGALYNWPAALTACPAGWHLPSDAEFTILANTAGGSTEALISAGWFDNIFAGYRSSSGSFSGPSEMFFWSSSASDSSNAWSRSLTTYSTLGRGSNNKAGGFSVRCIKDTPVLKNGGFESGNLTWWNTEGDASVSSSYKHLGNYGARVYAQANANQTTKSKITQTADLTGKNYLRFFYRYDGSTDCIAQGGFMYIYITIDGISTTLLSEGGTCRSPSIGWTERIIDISSYSGVKLIEFESKAIGNSMEGSHAQISLMIDDIEILDDISYGVTYDANGGSCTPENRVVSHGSATDAPSCSKTGTQVTGYTITSGTCASGWNNYTGYCGNVTGPITIRANWWTCGNNWVDPRDGQSYKTKLFSSGCWMTQNLNYANGRICYQNNLANCAIAGGLYATGVTPDYVCPPDWVIPTRELYDQLRMQLGHSALWVDPEGWNAQRGGWKYSNGRFIEWNVRGEWLANPVVTYNGSLTHNSFEFYSPAVKQTFCCVPNVYQSVRCVKL